jgi:hypothetical protein
MDERLMVDTRLGALPVRVRGEGPVAVLWHSLFVDDRTWNRVEDDLARVRRLVIITGPGHGASRDPGAGTPWTSARGRRPRCWRPSMWLNPWTGSATPRVGTSELSSQPGGRSGAGLWSRSAHRSSPTPCPNAYRSGSCSRSSVCLGRWASSPVVFEMCCCRRRPWPRTPRRCARPRLSTHHEPSCAGQRRRLHLPATPRLDLAAGPDPLPNPVRHRQ